MLGAILADVVVMASKGTWARPKICAAEDCRGPTTTTPKAAPAGGAPWRRAATGIRSAGIVAPVKGSTPTHEAKS